MRACVRVCVCSVVWCGVSVWCVCVCVRVCVCVCVMRVCTFVCCCFFCVLCVRYMNDKENCIVMDGCMLTNNSPSVMCLAVVVFLIIIDNSYISVFCALHTHTAFYNFLLRHFQRKVKTISEVTCSGK